MKFGAEWCSPCKTIQHTIDELILENPNHEFIFVDIDEQNASEITQHYRIKSIPTIIFTNNNEELRRFTGVKTKNQIQEYIDELS